MHAHRLQRLTAASRVAATTRRSVQQTSLLSRAAAATTIRSFACTQRCIHSNTNALFRTTTSIRSDDAAAAAAEDPLQTPREGMDYDVVVVGAGPAGLAAAIRLKKEAAAKGKEINVCVVEKGAEIGSHILSGNVFDPRALDELIPEWREDADCPIKTPVKTDKVYFLTETSAIPLPVPPSLHNEGNFIISLSQMVRWLATKAEALGVEIYPGFAASEVLYDEKGAVTGIATKDVGIGKDGKPKDTFTRGMELRGKQTLFAEVSSSEISGYAFEICASNELFPHHVCSVVMFCAATQGTRGSCSEALMAKFNLRQGVDPQTYGLGIKEIWEVQPEKFKSGYVQHTLGFPSPADTWSGSFMYHYADNKVLLGLVVGLDYSNTYISPYQEMQKFKTHPMIKELLSGGTCVEYGARVINEGGYQSIPKLTFPGGALIGCAAGFLNVPRVKGSHTAMKSGMLAADAIMQELEKGAAEETLPQKELTSFTDLYKKSWVHTELQAVRNFHPSFHKFGGLYGFLLYSGLQAYIFRGKEPWTFRNELQDHQRTKPAAECTPIEYPKPDGVLTFDLLTNLQRSAVKHNDDQPSHLKVKKGMENVPAQISWKKFKAPETRFCPAKVYEMIPSSDPEQPPRLQINNTNCVHCKSCAIKTPELYIDWTVPEGSGGPNYQNM